jgi:serine phosphatase RsbU (regulator of sigma subunit)
MLNSIRARLGVVFVSFLLLITASVAATGVSVRTQTHDALVINLAGRQRMLTQKMTKAVLGIALGHETKYQAELAETADWFDEALFALLDGGPAHYGEESVTLPPATDGAIRSQLEAVATVWERFRQQVGTVQTTEPGSPMSVQAVQAIESLSSVILGEMDSAVRLFEAAAQRKLIRLHAIQGLFFASAVGLLIAGYLLTQRTIVKPVSALEAATEQIGAGDLETPVTAERGSSGEVRALASSLESMRYELLTSRGQLERSAADLRENNEELAQAYHELQEAHAAVVEKDRLERELELARKLQQSILPQEFRGYPGLGFAASSRPARQVGGDFYDVIPLSDGRVGLVMADVSDKGMAAALYMALTRSLIHAEARRSSSPREVLLSVHRLLLEMSQADMFVTIFYGVLDAVQGTLRYARAGHDQPLLFSPSSGACRLLAAEGMLLGMWEQVTLEEVETRLRPGDSLVLYSDGITEATSPAGECFGVERLCETVSATEGLSAEELCEHIFERVDRFQAGAVQRDDMALMVVKAGHESGWGLRPEVADTESH